MDYFGARYYANGLGRWISADWSATPVPVPYADLSDPQTLNLYGYVRNTPATRFDFDGQDGWDYVIGIGKELFNTGLGATHMAGAFELKANKNDRSRLLRW